MCDGFLLRNNIIIALFESKCRNLNLQKLEEYGSWLVTHEKIKKCKFLSEYLKVPFLGFLHLIDDNLTMFWKITDKNGDYMFSFEHGESLTQKTINGGEIIRDNALLPVNKGEFIKNIKLNN